jgi:aspartate aminotransferase-like enzyme
MILEEGLTTRFERHQRHAAAFREGIKALGLELWAHPEVASPTVSCVRMPDGITFHEFLGHLRQDHELATLPG